MEGKSPAYIGGVVVGVAAAIILVALLKRVLLGKSSARNRSYDERQTQALGRAYKYAYHALLIYVAAIALFDLTTGVRWCSLYTAAFIGILLSVGVFGVVSILHDAYLPLRQSSARYIALFAALGGINVAVGAAHFAENGSFIEEGLLSHSVINPLAGLLLLVMAATMAVRNAAEKRQSERETK